MNTLKEVSEKVNSMNFGEVMLVSAREVNGGKVALEIHEKIKGDTINLVSMINQSDERFSQNKARRGWITGQKSEIEQHLGIKLEEYPKDKDSKDREVYVLGIKSPNFSGHYLRLQIQESLTGTEWDMNNLQDSVKQDGQGNYLTYQGSPIFSKIVIVAGTVKHQRIQHDGTTKILNQSSNIQVTEDAKAEVF